MEQRISLVALGVAELARARAFYEGLGWRGAKQQRSTEGDDLPPGRPKTPTADAAR